MSSLLCFPSWVGHSPCTKTFVHWEDHDPVYEQCVFAIHWTNPCYMVKINQLLTIILKDKLLMLLLNCWRAIESILVWYLQTQLINCSQWTFLWTDLQKLGYRRSISVMALRSVYRTARACRQHWNSILGTYGPKYDSGKGDKCLLDRTHSRLHYLKSTVRHQWICPCWYPWGIGW